MTETWKDDNCAAIKAHYAVLSIPKAAALWCCVPDDYLEKILSEVTQLSESGFGRGVWCHPDVPCLEPRSRAIAEAIESGELSHGREDAAPVASSDHVAYERRHIFGRDLKAWMEKAFPNEKPAFLFDDIEQNSHSSISAESYRALKAERDTLKSRLDAGLEKYRKLRDEKESIEAERDAIKKIVDDAFPASNGKVDAAPQDSQYWNKLGVLASQAIEKYPAWRDSQRKVQKTGNLQEWLTTVIEANNREAEIIKNILADFYQELR
ncbi:hypothetical protein [Solemya velum gill symbiont]|uniref:hypothetical protein n=1 Tax=Solemya velum gill symbiont TaxID=2340 RepID=UPI0009984C76|nr:hypothetical protein [Solemya velum gill symbiont]OOY57534.1 hypothetical protein BOV99_00545 [Solemya velum gill symbiont]OOY58558.1 hypothetical protein BOW00_00545 [Solemya velum gill symbiont]OOY71180.1 hypothetical protein BOW07_00545 [Solemya velum gill symbiont]OOY80966.1 hypothetical protein BOW11_02300 [Solemya velum gill symbiont]OOY95691.1 hypothetical protein BOW17_01620 [Solemya velum gill symbiont]